MTNTLPSFDIVILSLNRSEMTIDAARSALKQVDCDVHIWIVDQGSAPEELATLRQFAAATPALTLVERKTNLGVAGGRNVGYQLGKAPYIISLDNDAEFENDTALRDVARRFTDDPTLGAIGFRVLHYASRTDDERSWAYPTALRANREVEFETTRFVGGAHALRRDVLSGGARYDDALFFYWEEIDLSMQLLASGWRIIYFPQIRILHKTSPEMRVDWKGRRYFYLVRNAVYLQYKYFRSIPKTAFVAAGYLAKGAYNGLLFQTLKALWAVPSLCRECGPDCVLSSDVINHLWKHEGRYRGSLLRRVRTEVLRKLP